MTKPSFAQGGGPPLGAPINLLEIGVGPGQRYDPDRDILFFWQYLMSGIMNALKRRTIPVLEEFDANPDLERRVTTSYIALVQSFTEKIEHYDELINKWYDRCDDKEAADFIMKIIGRTCIQFYAECVLMRGVQPDQIWPLGLDYTIASIVASPDFVRSRLSRWIRFKRAALAIVDLLRW